MFSKKDDTVLIAINVKVVDHMIEWFDTVKERKMQIGEILESNTKKFSFLRSFAGGGEDIEYSLIPLTMSIYNEKVMPKLPQARSFDNEEAMLKSFEDTIANAW